MICPFAGHAQPLAERDTGVTGVVACGLAWGALVMGGGAGTGVATTGALARGAGTGDGLAGRVATLRGALPLNWMRWPGWITCGGPIPLS